jgi:hypothetical protein
VKRSFSTAAIPPRVEIVCPTSKEHFRTTILESIKDFLLRKCSKYLMNK